MFTSTGNPRRSRVTVGILLVGALAFAAACGSDNSDPSSPNNPIIPVDPDNPDLPEPDLTGPTSFVSADDGPADPNATDDLNADGDAAAAPDEGGRADGERTVEEGDIYRVLAGDMILNLNAYRGLQVIDFSDVDNPRIVGRLQVTGTPVELYTVGDVAYVLMNNWRGYYGARNDIAVEQVTGGLVMAVDLSDPTQPREVARSVVPGNIQTSRVTRQGDAAALYAVASWWGPLPGEDADESYGVRTVVKSFDLAGGELHDRTVLNLGGYVTAVQATPQALLVARYDWNRGDNRTRVSIVDITDPGGAMVEGGEVAARGYVGNQFNLDLYNGVLRVVSTGAWSGTNTNHIETFDASDIHNLSRIDHETFGDGMQLFATIFLGNKAFFVTYFLVDPFHAFEITDEGYATEISEFIVSGWNNFFRAVADETRLIGIGVNDETGRNTMAVSLYDITDLHNPNPLIDRAEVEAASSWSEANWDHRAFSVVENAVRVEAPDGTIETGLVLLPFHGWDAERESYSAAVQIYTFSADTLTRRGLMEHGTPVRRSFLADDATTANLSESEISFFGTRDPDSPRERGRLELAPNYNDVIPMGDHIVRVKDSASYYYGWWGGSAELPATRLEVIAPGDDPDAATPIASVLIPSQSQVVAVGDLIVAYRMQHGDYDSETRTYEITTNIVVIDFSDPARPQTVGTLETDVIRPEYSYWGGGWDMGDCWDCRGWGWGSAQATTLATRNALAFHQPVHHSRSVGMEHVCSYWPRHDRDICNDRGECYINGHRSCRTPEGGETVCSGSFQRCQHDGSDWTCEPLDHTELPLRENCYSYERYRYWQQHAFAILDLSVPSRPQMAPVLELPEDEEGQHVLADGDRLLSAHRVPVRLEDDRRPHARYFFREIDLSVPADPVLGDPINIPGNLLEVSGANVYTVDQRWDDEGIVPAVARLIVHQGLAYLQASHTFTEHHLQSLHLDGAGHVLATLRPRNPYTYDYYDGPYYGGYYNNPSELAILSTSDLRVSGMTLVDSWATLVEARVGRALFQVPGGVMVVNTMDPSEPFAQAYFPANGWPQNIRTIGDHIVFAAGRFGIYRFGVDTYNLAPPLD